MTFHPKLAIEICLFICFMTGWIFLREVCFPLAVLSLWCFTSGHPKLWCVHGHSGMAAVLAGFSLSLSSTPFKLLNSTKCPMISVLFLIRWLEFFLQMNPIPLGVLVLIQAGSPPHHFPRFSASPVGQNFKPLLLEQSWRLWSVWLSHTSTLVAGGR